MSALRRALAIAQPIIIVLAFVLLGELLRSQWDSLRTYQWQIRLPWLVASGACVIAGWLIEIRMWQRLLALMGGPLPYFSTVRIWFASAIVRYLPGNIWQPLSLTMRCGERGVRPEATLASLTLFQSIHLMAVGPIAAVYLGTWGRASVLPHWLESSSRWWAIALAAPTVFFLIRPGSMLTLVNAALVRIGRDPLPLRLTTGQLLRLLGVSLTAWVFFCAGFTALAGAILPPFAVSFRAAVPHLVAAYPIAFVLGFLSLLTPGGLGVREGILFLLLSPIIGGDNAIVIAIAMRLWELALEGALSGGAFSLPWLRRLRSWQLS
jgi:hypothetical protein